MTEDKARILAVDAARLAVDVASEKLATDIVMLDMRAPPSFTDYFVILSAESRRQMQGLLEDIDQAMGQSGVKLHHREGTTDGGWVLSGLRRRGCPRVRPGGAGVLPPGAAVVAGACAIQDSMIQLSTSRV